MFEPGVSSGTHQERPDEAPLDTTLDLDEDEWPDEVADPALDAPEVETAEDRAARLARARQTWLRHGVQRTYGNTEPSALLAMELDIDTSNPENLSDTELIDTIVGFERITAWAQARQTETLAEFARRRPGDDNTMVAVDKPCALGRFAPDEVGLALRQSRMSAKAKLGRAVQLAHVLPETLKVWKAGRLDERRVAAICDAAHYLPEATARAVQQRVLPRAPEQTLAQVKAAVKRAVQHVDPDGSHARHRAAHRERRVVLNPEEEGMASLWTSMSATDAQACFGALTLLAKGLGRHDPRGIDNRRSDLVVALLTGVLTHAAYNTHTNDTNDIDADTADDTGIDTDDTNAADDIDGIDDGDEASPSSTAADAAGATDDDASPSPAAGAGAGACDENDTSASEGASETGSETEGSGGEADTSGNDNGAAPERRSPGRGAPEQSGTGGSPPGNNAGGLLPKPVTPNKPLVQVLMPFSTLIGADDQPCELVGHGPIPAQLAREIAADANLRRLVYDPLSGTVLDYGRKTYRPPVGLADFVRARDVYCRNPICRRRMLDSHLDHIQPFPQGPTNDKNLNGCCGHDHLMKHAPGWTVRALPDGRIQWRTPTGHRYYSHHHDYRPDPDPPTTPPRNRPDPTPPPPRMTQQDYDDHFARRPTDPPLPRDETGPPPF